VRGVAGVTYTTSFYGGGQGIDVPSRINYNLRKIAPYESNISHSYFIQKIV
jgi:hypothetical protein